jgi:tRNA nucleotidyltransferase (CCA-adding enzyme)
MLVGRYHLLSHKLAELRPAKVLDLLEHTDALRRPERFEQFILACEADARGRKGLEQREYPQAQWLREARARVAAVALDETARTGLAGPQIAERLRLDRIEALREWQQQVVEDGSRLARALEPPGPRPASE